MKIISSQTLCETGIFRVTLDHAVDPGGFEIKRAIVQHPGSAVVLPLDAQKRILLVRQYRLPARQYLWELPAGKIDPGETALQAAKRELKEETGCRAKKWTKICDFYPSPGFLGERMSIFLARELAEGEATPMDDERIEKAWFTVKQVEEMLAKGKILDAKTMIGFLRWHKDLRRR
jgi:ADP-ribose pyrophosphatase